MQDREKKSNLPSWSKITPEAAQAGSAVADLSFEKGSLLSEKFARSSMLVFGCWGV